MSEPQDDAKRAGRSYGVTDEVWRELQQEVSSARSAERRALLLVTSVVAGLVLAAAVVQWSGLLTPRLNGGDNSGGGFDPATQRVSFEFDVHNQGLTAAEVSGWRSRLHGVVVESSRPSTVRLPGRAEQRVFLTFRVTDCEVAVPAARQSLRDAAGDAFEVGVQVRRPWGAVDATIAPPGGLADLVLYACGVDRTAEGA